MNHGVFYNVFPEGNVEPNAIRFPQLNEAGTLYFPSINAQLGALRSPGNTYSTRICPTTARCTACTRRRTSSSTIRARRAGCRTVRGRTSR